MKRFATRLAPAVAIVLVMIASSFVTLAASEQNQPATIWTSKEEYIPGETVMVLGKGFLPGLVTITISHPEFTKTDTCVVGADGRFVYSNYTASWVSDSSVPVTVTAYQDANHQATTQFFDPEATVLAWNLIPQQKWEKGNIKGYNEGDSIPMEVTLQNPGITEIVATIGLDFIDTDPTPVYGLDYLTQYNLDPPVPPYNTWSNSSQPFSVSPSQGTIVSQARLANQYEPGQTIQVWTFTLRFASGADVANIKFGAHLALTTPERLGAAYYPGSSLHVKILSLVPPFDQGNRDVPITVSTILTPPNMTLEKDCLIELVLEGDTMSFLLHYNNTGQAEAVDVVLNDTMPNVLAYIPGSAVTWNSLDPTHVAFEPFVISPQMLSWDLDDVPGTGKDSQLPVYEGWIQFDALVISDAEGEYVNYAFLNFTDDHGGFFPMVQASCAFMLGELEIALLKDCPDYAHVGDVIDYTYTVTNEGTIDVVDLTITDDVLGTIVSGDTLAAGATAVYTATYEVQADDPDPLVNVATATGTDASGHEASDEASCTVDILHPEIEVTKTADKVCAKIGETVTYTISVTNPSYDTDLTDVDLTDSILGDLLTDNELVAGQTVTKVVEYVVPADASDPLVNIVTAEGYDVTGYEVDASASWEVDILHPMIALSKEADLTCAGVGDTITYTITVSNPSWDTDMSFVVDDSLLGSAIWSGVLSPGGSESMVFTYLVTILDPDPLVNEATVTAMDKQDHVARASSSWSVDILHPGIEITKTATTNCPTIGEEVVYTITISSPTWVDTWLNGTVSDPAIGFTEDFQNLKPGESLSWGIHYVIQATDPDPFVNTAMVTATDHQGHEVTAQTSFTADILHPAILIEKSGPEFAEIGDTIMYSYLITNPSLDTDLYNITLLDDQVGFMWVGDLSAGSSTLVEASFDVLGDPDPLVNTVLASGEDECHNLVQATATWTVIVLEAQIGIQKVCPVQAYVGDVVTYEIIVSNLDLDDTVLYDVQVWDDALGFVDFISTLDIGQSVSFFVDFLVPDTPGVFVNTANAMGVDLAGAQTTATDTCSLLIIKLHPAIDLEKSGPAYAETGDTIIYSYVITNPSTDTDLFNVTLVDDQVGLVWTGNLAADSSVLVEVFFDVIGDPDPLVNTATVTGEDVRHDVVQATATWTVIVLEAQIGIQKVCPIEAFPGDVVTYEIIVTNLDLDDTVLFDVQVWDDALGFVEYIPMLDLGESVSFLVDFLVPDMPGVYVNTANAFGVDLVGTMAFATDSCSLFINELPIPMINVTKTANTACPIIGETVTYTITVGNPSPTTPMHAVLSDSLLGADVWVGDLDPGMTHAVVLTYVVTDEDPDPLVNTATVVATDFRGDVVTASATVVLDILHPAIMLEKSGPQYAEVGDTIIYSYVITNPSLDTPLFNVTLVDDQVGLVWTGSLDADSSTLVEVFFDVFGDPDPLVNTATVTGEDLCNNVVQASASWTVIVLEAQIGVQKICPDEASVGDVINYQIIVTNLDPDDTVLFDVQIVDELLGISEYIPMLAPGESYVIDAEYTVPAMTGMLINVVDVFAVDLAGVQVYATDICPTFILGQINGMKLLDVDMDGDADDMDQGIANWVIYLNGTTAAGDPVSRTTLTDTLGFYQFTGLRAGDYVVEEQMLPGWMATGPTSFSFTVTSGFVQSFDFLNTPTGSISGYKFLDQNMNGEFDEDEMGLAGWTIDLSWMMDSMEMHMTAVTDANGYYQFTDLSAQVYTVSEVLQEGWVATTPTSVVVDVTAPAPFNVMDIDFGNIHGGCIEGMKWLDEFMNGYKDGYEPPLAGWTIVLTGTTFEGAQVGPITTLTDEWGQYSFDDLMPGVYIVEEVLPDGWYNVTPSMREITVLAGSCVTCAKFGNVELGSIEGWKFFDLDMDGLKDGDEPGIPGWEITLTGYLNDGVCPWSMMGTPVGPITVLTDENGVWSFDDLLPGIYTVSEETRDGWTPTTKPIVTLWITSGLDVKDVKFGNVLLQSIEGEKFNDMNGNGMMDDGEPTLPGWIIKLTGTTFSGKLVTKTAVTDEEGSYDFVDLLPGTYTVYEVLQDGWVNTTPLSVEVEIPMATEPVEITVDFGNFQFGTVTGSKYEDVNGNGILDDGDQPIAGWMILLIGDEGTRISFTDENGMFEFTGLMAGSYVVSEESREDWVATSPSEQTVTVFSGASLSVPVFLNAELGEISVFKFEDMNSNGVWDDGEPGIEGWLMQLETVDDVVLATGLTGADGILYFEDLMPGEYVVSEEDVDGWTHTTDDDVSVTLASGGEVDVTFGNFHNAQLSACKYEDVNSNGQYDPEVDRLIVGWMMTFSGPGVEGGSVTVPTGDDGCVGVVVTAAGEYTITEETRDGWTPVNPSDGEMTVSLQSGDNVDPYFGNFKNVSLTIIKYEDVNCDGQYQADIDRLLPDWEFDVDGPWGEPEFFTGEDGSVTVWLTLAGDYIVEEEQRDGWTPVDPENGVIEISVQSGDGPVTLYFGNFKNVQVSIFKYADVCALGYFDIPCGDYPLEGWGFIISGTGEPAYIAGVTDEYGYLNFTVTCGGTFTIEEESRDGWEPVNPESGVIVIEVLSGDEPVSLSFGNFPIVTIPVLKYEDVNCNGVFDDGDRVLEGWVFTLVEEEEEIDDVQTGVTGPDGMLFFEVDEPGTYLLSEELKEGWTSMNPESGSAEITVDGGVEVPVQEFGNFHNVVVVVYKFDDIDGDGQQSEGDGADMPLAGWNFTLYEEIGDEMVEVATGTTNEDGIVIFVITCAGTYDIEEEDRVGWVHTVPADGEYEFDVVSGMDQMFLTFGNFKFGKIVGEKIDDLNANGVRDEGEPGLAGWTIWLSKIGLGQIAFTVTDAAGHYEFTGLVPGDYVVYEVLQDDWISTNGIEHGVTVLGHSSNVIDFLNARLGSIIGSKYEDLNGNGVMDAEDVPLAGWTIYLYDEAGQLIAITETDEDGVFEFSDLEPGTYVVVEEVPDDWVNTTSSMQTVVLSGVDVTMDAFLNTELAEIIVIKYEDLNSNGVWDEGEPVIEGWPMELETLDDEVLAIGYTDSEGIVEFDELMPGVYVVSEMDVEGWTHTTEDDSEVTLMSGDEVTVTFGNFHNVSLVIFKYEDMNGNGVYDSEDSPIAGWAFEITGPEFPDGLELVTDEAGLITVWITVAGEYMIMEESVAGWIHVNPESGMVMIEVESGDQVAQIDFGNMMLGEIIISKFNDIDLDLDMDEDEVGLAGFVFWVNGTLTAGGYLNFTVITDSNGVAQLSGLPAGVYVVTEMLALSPPGWTPTTPIEQIVEIGSGSVASLDFGNAIIGTITGVKFYDKNLNGERDEGEPALPGWTIVLSGTNDEGDEVYETDITDESGAYSFDEVVPGVYDIDEVLMDGWMSTTELPVALDLSGATEIDVTVDIGNIRLALINGHKFLDEYGNGPYGGPNGVFDEDESGIGNWEITLQGRTQVGDPVDLSVLTDNIDDIGYYEFADLMPGTYWLNETLLFGYMATTSISHMLIVPSQLYGPFVFVIDFGNTIPAPDPEVRFKLDAGWNLWSCPVKVNGLTAKSLLKTIGANAQMVLKLNSATEKYSTFVTGLPDAYDFEIRLGEGYYIYAFHATVFTLKGDLAVQSATTLNTGWNIVGYDKIAQSTASGLLSSLGQGASTIVYLDSATQLFHTYTIGYPSAYDFAVTPGRAYFVWTAGTGL